MAQIDAQTARCVVFFVRDAHPVQASSEAYVSQT